MNYVYGDAATAGANACIPATAGKHAPSLARMVRDIDHGDAELPLFNIRDIFLPCVSCTS